MVPANSPRGFPRRRDLKGCLEFQAQTGCTAKRRQAKSTVLKEGRPRGQRVLDGRSGARAGGRVLAASSKMASVENDT